MNVFYLLLTVGLIALLVWYTMYTDKQAKKKREIMAEHERAEREAQERKERKDREAEIMRIDRLRKLGEVKRQAEVVGDDDVVKAVLNDVYRGEMPKKLDNGLWTSVFSNLDIMKIAGINYRGNLSAYVGDFKGVLVPEPKNDYDPNAITIKCEDGKHIGYVPEDLTASIRERLGDDFKRYRITGTIEEHEEYDDEDDYEDERTRKFFTGYINTVYK